LKSFAFAKEVEVLFIAVAAVRKAASRADYTVGFKAAVEYWHVRDELAGVTLG
jgi:hypothetical protein